MKTGYIILTHGSRREEVSDSFENLVELVRELLQKKRKSGPVQGAVLTFNGPRLPDVVGDLVNSGIDHLIIMPLFLFPGAHVREGIPGLIKDLRKKYPQVYLELTGCIGADPQLAEIILQKINSVL